LDQVARFFQQVDRLDRETPAVEMPRLMRRIRPDHMHQRERGIGLVVGQRLFHLWRQNIVVEHLRQLPRLHFTATVHRIDPAAKIIVDEQFAGCGV
jgi:hypothetical protein